MIFVPTHKIPRVFKNPPRVTRLFCRNHQNIGTLCLTDSTRYIFIVNCLKKRSYVLVLCSMNVSFVRCRMHLYPFGIFRQTKVIGAWALFAVISAAGVAIVNELRRGRTWRATPADVCRAARISHSIIGPLACSENVYIVCLFWKKKVTRKSLCTF